LTWEALLVEGLVIAVRLLLPLTIPRYPLSGVIACLLFDAADQSILEAFGLYLPSYQNIDKALDVYYLSIAYVATMRNWESLEAFQVGRLLFYYRLIGVLAFELTGVRLLLAIFPNAFEPFFIYYELRRRSGLHSVSWRTLAIAVSIIWLALKLPQEWWIHVARWDGSDFLKTKILGASLDTPFWLAVVRAPLVTGAIVVAFAIGGLALWRFLKGRRASADPAEREARRVRSEAMRRSVTKALDARDWVKERTAPIRPAVMIEKIVLVTLVSMIFQQTLPGMAAGGVQTALFIGLTIVVVDYLLRGIAGRYGRMLPRWLDIPLMGMLDFLIVLAFQLVIPIWRSPNVLMSALVFAALITFFVTLYDFYRPLYDERRDRAAAARA
jgi:hypothetical protein